MEVAPDRLRTLVSWLSLFCNLACTKATGGCQQTVGWLLGHQEADSSACLASYLSTGYELGHRF